MARFLDQLIPRLLISAILCSPLLGLLTSCQGSSLLDEPQALVIEKPLATATDSRLEVYLSWIITPGGPGSWAKDAFWDEYLVRLHNVTGENVRITRIVVQDFLDARIQPNVRMDTLRQQTKATQRRYKAADMEVLLHAGLDPEKTMLAGTATYAAGATSALGVLAGTVAPSAAYLSLGAMLVAPVVMISAANSSRNEDRVAQEMITRHSPLPLVLGAGQSKDLDLFYPLTPSPKHIEVTYLDAEGKENLVTVDLSILAGLHLEDAHENR